MEEALAQPEYVLKTSKRNYPILITNAGIARMERETGLKLPALLQSTAAIMEQASRGKRRAPSGPELEAIFAQHFGMFEVLALLYAGLEGYRIKYQPGTEPWTVDGASEVMSDSGGMREVGNVVGVALQDYWPKLFGKAYKAEKKSARASSKNAPASRSAK